MVGRILILAALGAGAAAAIGIRSADMSAEAWHVDPDSGARTGKPNDYLVAEGGDRAPFVSSLAPADLGARLDAVALAEARTEVLAGSAAEGWVTYLQRSAMMGFPDAVSVRIAPEGDGSRLTAWSRSRYGHSDLGVNKARLERWLAALEAG
ncbi:DUF1499 domain-containing protein [uncultured Jannaschia sp.]|uniref:DUF1499 domain-containing protein n=1 Tax=uncultured Jannaschia sp. TaxID=293347 RepID=UPI00262C0073|nr:DUF1499 domain-containing protein [uncultured Jannaschia sp.]